MEYLHSKGNNEREEREELDQGPEVMCSAKDPLMSLTIYLIFFQP